MRNRLPLFLVTRHGLWERFDAKGRVTSSLQEEMGILRDSMRYNEGSDGNLYLREHKKYDSEGNKNGEAHYFKADGSEEIEVWDHDTLVESIKR